MKIIVAHPGRQHSYRVASALKKSGMLYKYVTTVYNKESSLLMRLVKLFLNKDNYQRAQRRRCPGLDDCDVVQFCQIEGLILLALIRIDKSRRLTKMFTRFISRRFQKKIANYIIKEGIDLVISYDCNSKLLFDILDKKAPHVIKVIDNAHPNRHYLYHSYRENWDSVGEFAKTMEACGYITSESLSVPFGEELKLADYHIVASTYSQKALEFEGISSSRIFRVPYGVDKNKFIEPKRNYNSDTLNVLFIGDVNQRKGIKTLLEVAKRMRHNGFTFNLIGVGYEAFPDIFMPYQQYVNFLGYVNFDDLLEQLKSNHVFLFPTMGEGFGLVLLEAMAAGLPIISTPNCGGYDLVSEGKNGFIVHVGDSVTIEERLLLLKSDSGYLQRMSQAAVETARNYTWDRYEEGIVSAIKKMIEE